MAMIYIFDVRKKLKKPIHALEYRHNEGMRTALAEVRAEDAPDNGEFFGFQCVDGKFRMFMVRIRDVSDETGVCKMTGTDAAIAELNSRVVKSMSLTDVSAAEAAQSAVQGTGWSISARISPVMRAEDAYFTTVWEVLKTIAGAAKVRFDPYYTFGESGITGRVVEMTEREYPFRGMIYTRQKGARNISITQEGVPYGRVYAVGKITGSENPPARLTFADAVWSKQSGDPADKPAGQEYVDLPGAETDAEYVYEDQREEDPMKLLEKAFEDLKEKQKPKAHGTANITDVEYMPGYEHRVVRLWDMAVIRTEKGLEVETPIKNIERYYVHKHLTKVTFGEEDEDEMLVENQLAKLEKRSVAMAKRLGGVGNGLGDNKNKIINAEELIQLNARRIEANAEEIVLRATKMEVLELEQETLTAFNEAFIEIDAAKAQIQLMASQTLVDNLRNEVAKMNATLTVQAGQIEMKANKSALDELGREMEEMSATLTVQAGQIEMKANKSVLDEVTKEMDEMSAMLTVQAGEISTKVEKNGVISAINQTAEEVKITASKINLEGYVTTSRLQAELSDINIGISSVVKTNTLNATTAWIDNLIIGSDTIDKQEMKVVTGVSLSKQYDNVPGADGIGHVVISSVTISVSTDTIEYLDW